MPREQHRRPGPSANQDVHDNEEEGIRAAPLFDVEGVECLAVGIAPHAVLVDTLAHVSGYDVVVVVVVVPLPVPVLNIVLKVTAYEGHFPLEVLFVVPGKLLHLIWAREHGISHIELYSKRHIPPSSLTSPPSSPRCLTSSLRPCATTSSASHPPSDDLHAPQEDRGHVTVPKNIGGVGEGGSAHDRALYASAKTFHCKMGSRTSHMWAV